MAVDLTAGATAAGQIAFRAEIERLLAERRIWLDAVERRIDRIRPDVLEAAFEVWSECGQDPDRFEEEIVRVCKNVGYTGLVIRAERSRQRRGAMLA